MIAPPRAANRYASRFGRFGRSRSSSRVRCFAPRWRAALLHAVARARVFVDPGSSVCLPGTPVSRGPVGAACSPLFRFRRRPAARRCLLRVALPAARDVSRGSLAPLSWPLRFGRVTTGRRPFRGRVLDSAPRASPSAFRSRAVSAVGRPFGTDRRVGVLFELLDLIVIASGACSGSSALGLACVVPGPGPCGDPCCCHPLPVQAFCGRATLHVLRPAVGSLCLLFGLPPRSSTVRLRGPGFRSSGWGPLCSTRRMTALLLHAFWLSQPLDRAVCPVVGHAVSAVRLPGLCCVFTPISTARQPLGSRRRRVLGPVFVLPSWSRERDVFGCISCSTRCPLAWLHRIATVSALRPAPSHGFTPFSVLRDSGVD